MRPLRTTAPWLFAAHVARASAAAVVMRPQEEVQPASTTEFDHELAAALVVDELNEKYTAKNGTYVHFFLEDCFKLDLPSCFALNADTPYGLTAIPLADGEDQYTDCNTKTGQCGAGCPGEGLFDGICVDNNQETTWRLGADEAVLLIGMAPPESVYWSITSSVMSQRYDGSPRVETLSSVDPWMFRFGVSCPDGPARCQQFASLGQPFNHNSLKKQNNKTGFSEPFALVLTASKVAWAEVSAAVESVGVPAFLHPLPDDMLDLGTDTQSRDTLIQLMRVAYPSNTAEMAAYYNATPISVLRLKPRNPTPTPAETYARRDIFYVDRATGEDEHAGNDFDHEALKRALDDLKEKIWEVHGSRPSPMTFVKPFFVDGTDCVDMGTECNGDCPDALYPISSNIIYSEACTIVPVLPLSALLCLLVPLLACCCYSAPTRGRGCGAPAMVPSAEEKAEATEWFWARCQCCACALTSPERWRAGMVTTGLVGFFVMLLLSVWFYGSFCQWGRAATIEGGEKDFFVVYGVNHAATGMASYASITAYHRERLVGLFSVSSEDGLVGSAAPYLGEEHPANPYLFAYRFSRDCAAAGLDAYCYTVPKDGLVHLPEGQHFFFIARAYVHPTTGTAPSADEIIFGSTLHFT